MNLSNANSMSHKILVVDDEEDVRELVSYNLKNEDFEVHTAVDGSDGFKRAMALKPDLILLDIMMPDIDGIELCRRFREIPDLDQTIIAFLTARGEDYTQIAGLNFGGDDFIVKPIKPTLLVSRVKALLRRRVRNGEKDEGQIIRMGDLILDKEKYVLRLGETEVEMAKKEFQILALLMENPGKVFSRKEIFRKIWGSEVIVGERTIDVHIRRIREKIGNDYIKTLKGVGYKIDF